MKMPAFQFYPADWRKDPGVQALSRHDQSVWFDMLCIMHESNERGVLLLNGRPIPEDALARMLNLDNQTFNQTLTNILTYGVASRRDSDGAIICRRMVRDEDVCQKRREAGKKGGNPNLVNQNSKQKPTTRVKQNPTPSSSTSSSITSDDVTPPAQPENKGKQIALATSSPADEQHWSEGPLTKPRPFGVICDSLGYEGIDYEYYRKAMLVSAEDANVSRTIGQWKSWIRIWLEHQTKNGPLRKLTDTLPTEPTPKSEWPAAGKERPGQVIAFDASRYDEVQTRMKVAEYKSHWPTANIYPIPGRRF